MQQFATTPTRQSTISSAGCYNTLTILVFPLAFYLLQLLGLLSPIATVLTGFLVLIKVVVEWSYRDHQVLDQRVSPRLVRPVQRARVLAQECFLCGRLHRPGTPFDLGKSHPAPVCERCRSCLSFSDQLTGPRRVSRQSGRSIF